MIEPLCNGWRNEDYYEMLCYENSKIYDLCMLCYICDDSGSYFNF